MIVRNFIIILILIFTASCARIDNGALPTNEPSSTATLGQSKETPTLTETPMVTVTPTSIPPSPTPTKAKKPRNIANTIIETPKPEPSTSPTVIPVERKLEPYKSTDNEQVSSDCPCNLDKSQ